MCYEISELFTRADKCVARHLSCSPEQTMCCEISELITRADICVARYLSSSLEQTHVLRDI